MVSKFDRIAILNRPASFGGRLYILGYEPNGRHLIFSKAFQFDSVFGSFGPMDNMISSFQVMAWYTRTNIRWATTWINLDPVHGQRVASLGHIRLIAFLVLTLVINYSYPNDFRLTGVWWRIYVSFSLVTIRSDCGTTSVLHQTID